MYQNFKKIYHAAIYVRISKEDGDIANSSKRESNSISSQKAIILDFLKDKTDIEVVSVRVDDGYTGSNFERPAFQAMMEDIKRGIVDCVVVKDLSRFGREYIDSGKYIERLFPALGVRFIAINDNYDSLQGKNQADEIIIPYVDDGVSGTHFNRLGFQKLQEDMKSGLIDCVIVKDFSRFGRDYLEVGFFIEYIFPLLQIRFISINDGYDSQASSGMTGGMNVALKNLINNMYSLDLSKKITSALRTRQRNGTQTPVRAKFGYKKDKDGKLVIDSDAAVVVKNIFEMAAKGVSFAEITRTLNDARVLTIDEYMEKAGKPVNFQRFDTITKKMWSPTTVSGLIRDEIYLGVRIWGRTKCSMHTGHKAILADKEEWIRIENAHEAIVDKELFDQANRLHPRKKRSGISESRKNHTIPRKAKQPALLICGNCGHALIDESAHILKCSSGRTGGDKLCREFSVRREELEAAIMEYVRKYAASMLADKTPKRADKKTAVSGNKSEILSTMKHLSSEKMKLYDDYKDGYISKEDYKELAETITQKLTKLQKQLDSIAEAENEIREADQDENVEWKELSALQTFDKEKLRQVIRVIRVYSQNEIEIEWKCDDGFGKSNS